jgi:cell division protein FtsB
MTTHVFKSYASRIAELEREIEQLTKRIEELEKQIANARKQEPESGLDEGEV